MTETTAVWSRGVWGSSQSLQYQLICFLFCNFLLDQADSSFDLQFWRQDVNDYLWSDWSSPISQFTASMWVKTSNYPFTLFSFGDDSVKIQFHIEHSTYEELCIWTGPNPSCRYVYYATTALCVPRCARGGGSPPECIFLEWLKLDYNPLEV